MRLANQTRPLPSLFIAIATWKWSMFSSLHFHFQLNSMEINNHYKLVKNMSLIKKNFLSRAYALPFLVSKYCWCCCLYDALLSCLSQLKSIAIFDFNAKTKKPHSICHVIVASVGRWACFASSSLRRHHHRCRRVDYTWRNSSREELF